MARLTEILAPRERAFFSLLEAAGANALRAADLLDEMLHSYPEGRELAREILICEQEGDRITHEIFRHLNETFVTPFEADDASNLALALDDLVDLAEEAADHLVLYRVEAARHDARRLAQILLAAARQIDEAMPRLRAMKDVTRPVGEIQRLEREADRVTREALAALFAEDLDAKQLIIWKDILERLEAAVDATKHLTDILAGIVVKNA